MDWITDPASGARCGQAMVPMRDGIRLNTFVFLPPDGAALSGHPAPHALRHRGGRRARQVRRPRMPGCRTRPSRCAARSCAAGAPSWRTAMPRSTRTAAAGTAPRARTGSMPTTRRTATTRSTGSRRSPGRNGRVGMSGSSAGATTTFAAASTRHPSLRAFFAQAGGSSIYDDVVYEGQSIEMERLWLWVSRNIPGLSAVASRRRHSAVRHRRRRTRCRRRARGRALQPARRGAQCLAAVHRLRPTGCGCRWPAPRISRPGSPSSTRSSATRRPTTSARRHNFRRTIDIPGFHVTSWFDIFQTSVIAAFQDIQARTGTQKLWIGPNEHYFVYAENFWPRDPYFEWFGYWLKDEPTELIAEPAVFYSPRAWVEDRAGYRPERLAAGRALAAARRNAAPALSARRRQPWRRGRGGAPRNYVYDPRRPVPTLAGATC